MTKENLQKKDRHSAKTNVSELSSETLTKIQSVIGEFLAEQEINGVSQYRLSGQSTY